MNENKITIDLWEYKRMVIAEQKLAVLERLFEAGYVSTGDIRAVLNIPEKKEEVKNEAV